MDAVSTVEDFTLFPELVSAFCLVAFPLPCQVHQAVVRLLNRPRILGVGSSFLNRACHRL